jgi:hypothetical protein
VAGSSLSRFAWAIVDVNTCRQQSKRGRSGWRTLWRERYIPHPTSAVKRLVSIKDYNQIRMVQIKIHMYAFKYLPFVVIPLLLHLCNDGWKLDQRLRGIMMEVGKPSLGRSQLVEEEIPA